ncbi:MAG: TolC family protein [Candidatus Marinimicrobia bacterium]|jgi:outer membrane protein|nr:TolC family protein [Candidatus Neomarinimicrobiota bacterium]MBT4360873.1 TolC family protein [Candidatus Neomarinimicrobiota bacterium]MBT4715335.1 TolC family protein [Candidatus Neomarinimicrobiota bacterium]MBT4946997.1 TolC family protein [Candidatus Neomarinimicrobiota bacterium]MBT5268374.1 TolC family protein [Candidatus Neomarinimicrobiota bacterium]
MNKYLLTLVISLTLINSVEAVTLELELKQAIKLALDNNVNMQNAQEDLLKAKAQRKEAFSSALPVVSAFGQASHSFAIGAQPMSFPIPFGVLDAAGNPVAMTDNNGNTIPYTGQNGIPIPGQHLQQTGVQMVPLELAFGSDNTMVYGLSLTQPLFEGRVIAAIRGANVYGDLASSAADVTRLSVIENTKKAYYGVLLADKMVSVMQNSLEVMQQNLQNVSALYAQGKTAEFDVIRADVQVANQTTMVSNARKMKELAYAGLKRSCGLQIDQDVAILGELQTEIVHDLDLADLERKMISNQPMLNQLEANVKLMKENILMVKAEFMPSIALTGSYQEMKSYNDDGFDDASFKESSSLAVGINMPIFNGFGSTARVQKAKADHRKSEYQQHDMKENLLLELKSIFLSIKESSRKIDAGLKGVEQAHKGVDMAQRLFQQGMASQLQVLDAQSASDQAELGLYQAYFEYNSARASLARALGEE